MNYARIVRFAVAPLFAAVALTCAGRAAAEPPSISIVVQTPPEDMEAYPSVEYEGHPVYNVDGRYYYRDGDRWGYYREPPPALRNSRWERRAMRAQAWHEAAREHARREAFREDARRAAFRDEARRDAYRDQARRAAFREHDRRDSHREHDRGRDDRHDRRAEYSARRAR